MTLAIPIFREHWGFKGKIVRADARDFVGHQDR
jgi:hypothetical protein